MAAKSLEDHARTLRRRDAREHFIRTLLPVLLALISGIAIGYAHAQGLILV